MKREDIIQVVQLLWDYITVDWVEVIEYAAQVEINITAPVEGDFDTWEKYRQKPLILLLEHLLKVEALEDQPESKSEEFPDYRVHLIDCVECYTSNSGNRTWKAFDQDGDIIYLRQSQRKELIEGKLWDKLNAIPLGETCDVEDAQIHTIQDGDFHKPVQFEGDWKFQKPKPLTPDNQKLAIKRVQSWLKDDCVILDTETTGLGSAYPVEVTVIDLDGKELFNQRIKPPDGIEIGPEATKVHGIDAEAVKDCPEWNEVYPEFVAAIQDKTVLIYNADFDTHIINEVTEFYKLDYIPLHTECVMEAYAEYNGDWNDYYQSYGWVKLTDASKKEGLPVIDAHSALGDCQMTLALVKALASKEIVENKAIPF